MDVDRLSTGEKIAGVSAALLFIFMFFDWYSVDVSGGGGLVGGSFTGGNAWEWFSVIDIILLIAVVTAVAVVVVRVSDAVFEPPVSMNAIVAVLGGVAVLLILYRIIDPPGGGDLEGLSVDVNPAAGAILGLLAAAGVAFGGYRAMQEEGTSFADVGDQLSSAGRGGPGSGGSQQPPSQSPPPPPPPPPPAGGAPPAQ